MDEDAMMESNPMITDTRIKVVSPLRKILVGSTQGLFRLTGDVSVETEWCWRQDRYMRQDDRPVSCMASEPGTGALLAAFAEGESRLWVSEDGGRHWEPAPDWPGDRSVSCLATPGGGRVSVGTEVGEVFQGELPEGGWQPRDLPGVRSPVRGISWDLSEPVRWNAALAAPGVGVSRDSGATWSVEGAPIEARRVVHTRGGVTLASTSQGVFRSTDGGFDWKHVDLPGEVRSLCVDVAGTAFLTMEEEGEPLLWCSQDTGRGWSPLEGVDLAPDEELPLALEADSFHPGVVYLGSGNRVWLIAPEGVRCIAEKLPTIRCMLVI